MAYNSTNEANVVRQELYDATLEKSLDDWLVGKPLFDDKTGMFPDGDTLNITKTGDRAVSDYSEDSAISFDNMQTSRVDLTVTDYKQDGWYITDKLKQDGHQAESFWAENVRKSAIAMERDLEKACFSIANTGQTAGDLNAINGAAHRFLGGGTGGALQIEDIGAIKLAFDKAMVPTENRVLVISPEMEFELNKLLNITEVSNGSQFNFNVDGMVQTGFGDRLNIIRNIYGINLMVSHNLPDVTDTITKYDGTGSATVTGGKLCVAMSMADASSMPIMGVIRQRPQSEFFRNTHYKRDEWSSTCRYGFGLKRAETLATIVTPA
ncbi:MAG: putative minor capsid protein 10B [Prokaryotic dsDNA virus sp.]|nr:MAG: putative minor capsid protein 10B [Prokaryotic dsDNA virus sp.]|tara:strand:- start:320 stop:1288 length:969 start_codon:yes stop_codon:yes gene_type:complete